jgi:hypothetical protein
MRMITAICEMQDQDVGINSVQLIENTTEAIEKFEDDMDEQMGLFGHVFHYYDAEIPYCDNEQEIYRWMEENKNMEMDI